MNNEAKRLVPRPEMPAAAWRWVGFEEAPDPVSGVRRVLPTTDDQDADTGVYPIAVLDDLLALARIARK